MKRRHVPIRTCVGCRQTTSKKDMVRIVRTPEGRIEVDRSGKMSGRGAYICPRAECLELAVKRKALDGMLDVPIPAQVINDLRQMVEDER